MLTTTRARNAMFLGIGVFMGLTVTVGQTIWASFNQGTSSTNTVSAQGSSIQVADTNETTFAATVSGSLDKLTSQATGLTNDGINKFAGFVDILHIDGDTASSHYTLTNAPNPAPAANSSNAALNDNLKVIIWQGSPHGSSLAAGSSTSGIGLLNCPNTSGPFDGSNSPLVNQGTWSTLSLTGLNLPQAGMAARLCFYLVLPTTTPQSAAGGQVHYDLTLAAAP